MQNSISLTINLPQYFAAYPENAVNIIL